MMYVDYEPGNRYESSFFRVELSCHVKDTRGVTEKKWGTELPITVYGTILRSKFFAQH